ncbi:MAG TPA: hypothetical protein VGU01_04600 [Sphingomicrobium sp.]|nr:hypothetical protein [Sphingomicrobium sp.]
MRRLSAAAMVALSLASTCARADVRPSNATVNARSAPAVHAAKAPPNFDAILAAIDKMFPAQPAPDPARLALARISVQAMWPDGAYAKMMSGFIGNMFNGVMQMKRSDLAALNNKAGKNNGGSAAKDEAIRDEAAAKDPNFDQRMAAMRSVVDEEVGKISTLIDPRMRDGLAHSMARRFDDRELADINAFFATPSGHALASQYMQLWFDPDTMRSMMGAIPEIVKLMPDAMQKFRAVNERYPKPSVPLPQGKKH